MQTLLDLLRSRQGTLRRFPKNSIIYHEDSESYDIYFIFHGCVKLIKENNKKAIITSLLYPNDYFGEIEVITKEPRIHTAIARKACSIKIIQYNDELYDLLSKSIISNFHNVVNHLSSMGLRDTYGRLAYLFNTRKNSDGILEDYFTQQDLADLIGCSREGVCLILKELVEGEFISYDENKHIKIRRELPEKW